MFCCEGTPSENDLNMTQSAVAPLHWWSLFTHDFRGKSDMGSL